jgi:hypothetical protein
MRRLTFALLTFCALTVAVMSVTSCKKKKTVLKTLKEKIQGKTYVISTATLANADKTSSFKNPDLKLVFNADATTVGITTGGTTSATATSNCTVDDSGVTLTSNVPTNPGQWASKLNVTNSDITEDGGTLTFTVNIQSEKIGKGDYRIVCIKQ